MYNRDTVNEFVSLFNFLVAEATSAAARARFLAKAAGALPADVPNVRGRAAITRLQIETIAGRAGEHQLTAKQFYETFREANHAWGRCLTVRRKTLAAIKKELLTAAEGGNVQQVVELTLLLAKLTGDTVAERPAVLHTEVEVVWEDSPTTDGEEEVDEDNLPW